MSADILQTFITFITVGVVLGIFKGAEYLLSKKTKAEDAVPRMTEAACSKLRDTCATTLSGTTERLESQVLQLQEVRETVIRIEANQSTMVADLKLAMIEATDKATRGHERRYHDARPTESSEYSSPYQRRGTNK